MKRYIIPITSVFDLRCNNVTMWTIDNVSYQEEGYAPERILEGGSKVGQALYI